MTGILICITKMHQENLLSILYDFAQSKRFDRTTLRSIRFHAIRSDSTSTLFHKSTSVKCPVYGSASAEALGLWKRTDAHPKTSSPHCQCSGGTHAPWPMFCFYKVQKILPPRYLALCRHLSPTPPALHVGLQPRHLSPLSSPIICPCFHDVVAPLKTEYRMIGHLLIFSFPPPSSLFMVVAFIPFVHGPPPS